MAGAHFPALGLLVVGVDGSASARTAVLWAATEADMRGWLHIVHACDSEHRTHYLSPADVARVHRAGHGLLEATTEAVTARHSALPVSNELSRDAPASSLARAASRRDTIVVGHRGLGGFSSLLLGSVGLKAAAGAVTPVVVVRDGGEPAEAGRLKA
ncbi:universal stress protein [Streptomyces sp. NBC_01077]|uniref:universal stress protein n=1 Tax=Streptomyces sp. NBC_01077 TaxID=2903746 RepID=UPI00386839D6|nr:universal stress protein [Streptomyces sp. NBC_01077]